MSASPLRIVHVASGREWRGGQRQVFLLAGQLARDAGLSQTVITTRGSLLEERLRAAGVPVRTKGGWGQLNLRPNPAWMFGGGCGIDDPKDADVAAGGRLKNFVCEGHLEWRPPGPMIFGFEFRRLTTTYTAGDFRANHFNLAAGYRF